MLELVIQFIVAEYNFASLEGVGGKMHSKKPTTECVDEFNRGISKKIDERVCIEISDDYEHIDNGKEYLIENVLMEMPRTRSESYENLSSLFNSYYEFYCNCEGPINCNNSKLCKHGGCYSISEKDSNEKELTLNKNRNVKDLLYECNSQCSCSTSCTNRLVQFGPRKHLKIIQAINMTDELALTSEKFIPQGGFICEYAGEILTESEALMRNEENRAQKLKNYLICLNEYSSNQNKDDEKSASNACIQTFIDAGRKSNIGRYLNHSCDPNCEILSVRIDSPIPKLGIFARKDISAHEELCFDYDEMKTDLNNKQLCFCGTKKCRKYF